MKRLWFALLLIALPLAAQEARKEDEKSNPPQPAVVRVQKLFLLKYAEPNQVASLLGVFGATVRPNNDMHALTVDATKTSMAAIEEAIQRLDVPSAAPKNIEMTAYLLIGGENAGTEPSAMPKELDGVVTQLKNAFAFKNYRLLDTLELRTRVGQNASTNSVGRGSPNAQPVTSQFRIHQAGIGSDGTTIRIDGLNLSSKIPVQVGSGQFNYTDVGLSADVDIKQGQKAVIGRVSVGESALFLVLTAQVVN